MQPIPKALWTFTLLLLPAGAALSQNVESARQAAETVVDAILAGDEEKQSPAVCDVLESGILAEVFGVDPGSISYRPASKYVPQGLCTATWAGVEVGLTVLRPVFDSSEAAVASLESAVARLEEGFTISAGGRERTTQVDFDDWMDGVGSKAAWAPELSELSVAAGRVRFAVAVQGAGDSSTNQERAVEIARRVAAAL